MGLDKLSWKVASPMGNPSSRKANRSKEIMSNVRDTFQAIKDDGWQCAFLFEIATTLRLRVYGTALSKAIVHWRNIKINVIFVRIRGRSWRALSIRRIRGGGLKGHQNGHPSHQSPPAPDQNPTQFYQYQFHFHHYDDDNWHRPRWKWHFWGSLDQAPTAAAAKTRTDDPYLYSSTSRLKPS